MEEIKMSGTHNALEMYGRPAVLVLRVQMERQACLDFILAPHAYNLASSAGLQTLVIPMRGDLMERVNKGILDAEFLGF
jgi:hypothetical protein